MKFLQEQKDSINIQYHIVFDSYMDFWFRGLCAGVPGVCSLIDVYQITISHVFLPTENTSEYLGYFCTIYTELKYT